MEDAIGSILKEMHYWHYIPIDYLMRELHEMRRFLLVHVY